MLLIVALAVGLLIVDDLVSRSRAPREAPVPMPLPRVVTPRARLSKR
jgi:hypothetical protein